jgi:competence protein ComEA
MRRLSIKEIQIIGSVAVLVLIGFVAVSGNLKSVPDTVSTPEAVKTVAFPLDLNISTEEELDLLPGIGPSKAKAIVEYRKVSGGFNDVEELLNVKGIGAKTLDKLKPLIKVGEISGREPKVKAGPEPIDINTASIEELKEIPGIGDSKAKAIIDHREKNGKFLSVSDLLSVPGIGTSNIEAILERIKPLEVAMAGSGKINVNTANENELDRLPGIGPVLASRIVEYRKSNGRFSKCEELLKVKGIGESILKDIEELIEF